MTAVLTKFEVSHDGVDARITSDRNFKIKSWCNRPIIKFAHNSMISDGIATYLIIYVNLTILSCSDGPARRAMLASNRERKCAEN